ncbi:hypothetical protein [Microvirga rosea]|uniref:hypothetical protein n=1 Tax=Microvirga rosea TaxID=2715425 RepID=UPI001D0A970B|nr:hypothetical protein [Microvirga rosea]MCB8822407.1 hypothetical protein [Microvirga rosea]
MSIALVTLQERPDLLTQADELVASLWPTFVLKDPIAGRYWHNLYKPQLAAFQTFAVEGLGRGDRVVGFANAIPFRCALDNGDLAAGLPDDGWDAVLQDGVEAMLAGHEANALSALSITLHPDRRGTGLAETLIRNMKRSAREAGLAHMVAPIRPTRKAQYPLQSFEEYCAWTGSDGLPFDPWIRTHRRLGAHVLKIAGRSMTVPGSVSAWESWTGLRFPASGRYWVPGALAPVDIDREAQTGLYVEPNLWMHHPL